MGWEDSAAGDIYRGFMGKIGGMTSGIGNALGDAGSIASKNILGFGNAPWFRRTRPGEGLNESVGALFGEGHGPTGPEPGPFPGSSQSGAFRGMGLPIKAGPQPNPLGGGGGNFGMGTKVGALAPPRTPQPVGVSGAPGFSQSQQSPFSRQEESSPEYLRPPPGIFQLGVGMQDPGQYIGGPRGVTPLGQKHAASSEGGGGGSLSSEGDLGAVEKGGLMTAQAENELAQANLIRDPGAMNRRLEAQQGMAPGEMERRSARAEALKSAPWAANIKTPGDLASEFASRGIPLSSPQFMALMDSLGHPLADSYGQNRSLDQALENRFPGSTPPRWFPR